MFIRNLVGVFCIATPGSCAEITRVMTDNIQEVRWSRWVVFVFVEDIINMPEQTWTELENLVIPAPTTGLRTYSCTDCCIKSPSTTRATSGLKGQIDNLPCILTLLLCDCQGVNLFYTRHRNQTVPWAWKEGLYCYQL